MIVVQAVQKRLQRLKAINVQLQSIKQNTIHDELLLYTDKIQLIKELEI
jgi:hypothetical protein